jgi:hypothetical protein
VFNSLAGGEIDVEAFKAMIGDDGDDDSCFDALIGPQKSKAATAAE